MTYSRLTPSISQGFRKEENKFDYNKDAGMFVCPAGHIAIPRAGQGKKKNTYNQCYTYYFDIEKCRICSTKKGCYKAGAKSKTYSIPIKTDEQKSQIDFQQTDRFGESPGTL